jgi:hypothetical protein
VSVIFDYPILLFAVSFAALAGSAWFGTAILRNASVADEDLRDDFPMVLTATLTLLGLIIGFSFSMAISRYDQRKNLEEEEANAIGTEYVRAGLLPAADAARVRKLLKAYLDLGARRAKLQDELWAAVEGHAAANPTPIMALVLAGMNDVINSQGYTLAAWRNRIPHAAWLLMILIAVCSNVLIGYGAHRTKSARRLLIVMPLVVSISFFLVADIDSPRGGVIRIVPQNLKYLADSLPPS